MDRISNFRDLFAYDWWSNVRVADALIAAPASPENAAELLAHIVGAARLWFGRLQGDAAGLQPWPTLSLAESRAAFDELRSAWRAYLDTLTPERLLDEVSYTNSMGVAYSSTIGDILTQVINHSTYHRGQIASAMRRAGLAPVLTDFIVYARESDGRGGMKEEVDGR